MTPTSLVRREIMTVTHDDDDDDDDDDDIFYIYYGIVHEVQ